MPGQINRFQDLTVVRANESSEGWIVTASYRSGLFGPDSPSLRQVLKDYTLRIGDPAEQTFFASQKIDLEKLHYVHVFAGESCLWIIPYEAAQGDAVVFDLNKTRIAARVPNLSCRQFSLGGVTPEGTLIIQAVRRALGAIGRKADDKISLCSRCLAKTIRSDSRAVPSQPANSVAAVVPQGTPQSRDTGTARP